MKNSENINEVAAALAKAQAVFTNPPRNREVRVKTRTGDTYTFSYATLDEIVNMIRKPLADNGLALVHSLEQDEKGPICETRLIHASGQWLSTWVPLVVEEGANAQAWGSAITYARRYGLTCLLSVAADEDDDSNAACGNTATAAPRSTKPAPKQAAPKPADNEVQSGVMVKTIEACESMKSLVETLDALPGIFGETIPEKVKAAGRHQCEALALLTAAKGKELAKLGMFVAKTRFLTDDARARVLDEINAKKDSIAMAQ